MSMAIPDIFKEKKRVYQWTYKNPDEKISGYSGRYEDDNGNKIVVPFFKKKNGKYFAGIDLNPTPLYGLNYLAKRQDDDAVLIAEGEKCTLALIRLGYTAVTSLGGANAAVKADWSVFETISKVVIIPDNDEPGEKYAKDVYQSLKGVNPDIEIKILRIPNLPESGDVVDYIQQYEPDWNGYSNFDQDQKTSLRKRISKLLYKSEEVPESWIPGAIDEFDWQEPNEFAEDKLLPVRKLTDGMIPKPFRAFITDTSYRMQSPIEFVAIALIVATSSIIGNGCAVCPKQRDDWAAIINLWGACIGPPGVMMKSPAIGKVLSLLDRLQQKYLLLYEEQKVLNELERKEIESQISEIEKKLDEPDNLDDDSEPEEDKEALKRTLVALHSKINQPSGPRIFVTNDSSYQSLAKLHVTNIRGCFVNKDELPGMLSHWQERTGAQERAFYLTGWNGDSSYTDVKIGRELVNVPSICISLLGGIQPDRLVEYLKKTATGGNDGMLQRFQLMVYPDTPEPEYVDEYPNDEAKNQVYDILEKLAEMDFCEHGATKDKFNNRPYYRFSKEAQEIVGEWFIRLQDRITNESNFLIQEHLAKYRSLMPSLALIFHLVKIADSDNPKSRISEGSAKEAIAWCIFLESHARRIYGMVAPPSQNVARLLAKKIKEGKIPSPFKPKEVYDKKWSGLTNPKDVKNACNILTNENWLKVVAPSKSSGGRKPDPEYIINPALL